MTTPTTKPAPKYRLGQRVRIASGRFSGAIGLYRATNKRGFASLHLVELPGWGCVESYRIEPGYPESEARHA